MKTVCLWLGIICLAIVPVAAFSTQMERQEGNPVLVPFSLNWGLAAVGWFVLVGILDLKQSIERSASGGRAPQMDKLAEEVEQLRLHVEMVRKIKEAEWRASHPQK